jgi:hypothetical protein
MHKNKSQPTYAPHAWDQDFIIARIKISAAVSAVGLQHPIPATNFTNQYISSYGKAKNGSRCPGMGSPGQLKLRYCKYHGARLSCWGGRQTSLFSKPSLSIGLTLPLYKQRPLEASETAQKKEQPLAYRERVLECYDRMLLDAMPHYVTLPHSIL